MNRLYPNIATVCFIVQFIFYSLGLYAQDCKISKIKDVVIYKDSLYFSAFPSVIKLQNREIYVAFRRAPDRLNFNEKSNRHLDPNSYLVSVKSSDGIHWSDPDLIFAHPLGGSQDPCLLQLKDGEILCASYLWNFLRKDQLKSKNIKHINIDEAYFYGGYVLKSIDQTKSWKLLPSPCNVPTEYNINIFNQKIPAYNRGCLLESKDGRILWAVASSDSIGLSKTSVHLLESKDKGNSWSYLSTIASDKHYVFNETSLYETPKGDIIAFLRSGKMDDEGCIARSTNGGKSFSPWMSMGFKGHPFHALRLPDNHVLLTYGYRHKPYGIRAKILNPECTDFDTAKEWIIRDDADGNDVGYTWSVNLDKNRVLVVYYISYDRYQGTRQIAGSIIEIKK